MPHLLARIGPPWLAGLKVNPLSFAKCGSTVASNRCPVNFCQAGPEIPTSAIDVSGGLLSSLGYRCQAERRLCGKVLFLHVFKEAASFMPSGQRLYRHPSYFVIFSAT
jgi:hypothetical protein